MTGFQSSVRSRTDCRLCGSSDLIEAFSFGETPPANAYLSKQDLDASELFAPLTVNFCNNCRLVQLRDVVDPKVLFSRYLYVSGTSPSFVAHFADYAQTLVERFGLTNESLAVDIGSNDGTLLLQFKRRGTRILGIDPAENIAAEATKNGIPTLAAFFTPGVARDVATQHGTASVITANNVFAHTDDVTGFVQAVKGLLADDGVFVFEAQYLKDLVEQNLFDIVYHEHLCYYHLTPLVPFFKRLGMRLFDVEHVPTHGGSLRVYVCRDQATHRTTDRVGEMLQKEAPLNELSTYRSFAARITKNGETLRGILESLRATGKRVVGYGAPAKATTLCYALGIDASHLDYIVDDAPLKQGLYMPGTHIPIKSSDMLYSDNPDYCLILAWNFAGAIMQKHRQFRENGGRFIMPTPEPHILP